MMDINIHLPNFDNIGKGIKAHVVRNKSKYAFGAGVVFAGITYHIIGGVASQSIGRGISVTTERGISVLGKKIVMNNVSYISANRQGPPSWVVRCKETGDIFTSQQAAAGAMNLPANEISKHLNGAMDTVRGFNFERICMAA